MTEGSIAPVRLTAMSTTTFHALRRWLAPAHVCMLVAGALYVLIFEHFAPLPKDAFSYRDDAVITLSHAKNLVEYGSVGIDAAGARVEGFSTPLQFWIFALAYELTHCQYERFLDAQVGVCNFLLGCAIMWLLRRRPLSGLACAVALAFWLTTSVRFFGWHHSGMENAYTHVLFVALLGLCCDALERARVSWLLRCCALLATLARLESIVHIAPVLCLWSFVYFRAHRSFAAWRASAGVLLAWAAYQAYRYSYFGSLQPNTALAEGVDVLASLRGVLAGQLPEQAKVLSALRDIAREHRVYLALAVLPLLMLGQLTPRRGLLTMMLTSLALTALAHPLLFGQARLDPVRTTSHLALVPPLLILTHWNDLPTISTRVWSALCLAGVLFMYQRAEPASDTFFCCPIKRADKIADTCLAHAAQQDLMRPSLANPDLGRMSYRKDFLLFDLGLLGTPPLAVLHGDKRRTTDYLLDYAAPDFIELHGGWVCEYDPLLRDKRFSERYSPVPRGRKLGLSTGCRGQAGIWFRNDLSKDSPSNERRLHDVLRTHIEPARIAAELRSCELQPERAACAYVVRALYRVMPELVHGGHKHEIIALFERHKIRDYAVNLLQSRDRGDWYRPVVEFLRSP